MNKHRIVALVLAGILTPSGTISALSQTADFVGTVIRFSSASTIGEDNATVRDLLSRLPLNVVLEEYAGREKIGYFDPKLDVEDSDPEDGDLIFFIPWGNIGFYYNEADLHYSDLKIHLGTYEADRDQLAKLEGEVTAQVIP